MPSLTGETWLTESIMTEPAAPSSSDELVMETLYLILNETLSASCSKELLNKYIYRESKRRRGREL